MSCNFIDLSHKSGDIHLKASGNIKILDTEIIKNLLIKTRSLTASDGIILSRIS